MTDFKNMWAFFSVLSSAFEEHIEAATFSRWLETGIFEGSPFGEDDRYIAQGVRQVRLWLEDFNRDPGLQERLSRDYLQLFVGVPKPLAPFWGSFYTQEEKLLFHEKTAETGRWYRKYGLGVRQEKGMPDDYLVYELLFITVMLEAYQREAKAGNREKAAVHRKDAVRFAKEQMMTWIPQWRDDVMLYGRTEYYRGLSNMVFGSVRRLSEMEVEP